LNGNVRRVRPQLEALRASMSGPVMTHDFRRSAASDAHTGGNPESKSRCKRNIILICLLISKKIIAELLN
jgi:hypothetical protein